MTVNRMFTQKVAEIDRGMLASYKISNLIAKTVKPHTIGESLIMLAVPMVLSTVMKQSPQEVTSVIPLSNFSESRRIDEMASDVESQLLLKLFLDVDGIREELIFALHLTTDTKGESIFKKLEAYFEENNIPLKNILACVTDGAAAMIGSVISFLSETELGQKLVDVKSNILYLSGIFEKLNVLNKELQGNDSTLFLCKEAITAFIGKLKLFWLNLGRQEFDPFFNLSKYIHRAA
ncbi:zinc finger MYM-type protein 6-like [Oratosquilla oratoria]|uniref:zinc finger MYM-type protein 6-like n=1 Tax=Oratosquilla oratoria TaxID=337810 RepID=UPI003F777337